MADRAHPKDFSKVPGLGAFPESCVIRELEGGLLLRRATPADVPALDAFNGVAHADPPDFTPVPWVGAWARELANGSHPRCRAADFTVVEEAASRRLVSTLCLIDHELRYEDVSFPAGQIELVATHPDFRKRRLVAEQFAVVHEWSAERAQRLTLIDGIPWFYRQFGYEMALPNRGVHRCHLEHLRRGEPAAGLRVRPATAGDADFFARLFARAQARSALSCTRDVASLRFELAGREAQSAERRVFRVLEDAAGRPLAGFAHLWALLESRLLVVFCEVAEHVGWVELAETLLHAVADAGEEVAASRNDGPFRAASFTMPAGHPLFETLPLRFGDRPPPYAWWLRLPELRAFLELIAPVLERRLTGSACAGHSGHLELNLYREGLRLVFEKGALCAVESWQPDTEHRGDAALSRASFLPVLFGARSFAETEAFLPECIGWRETARPLLRALFPRRPSDLWLTA